MWLVPAEEECLPTVVADAFVRLAFDVATFAVTAQHAGFKIL
jgi:hypothetical protein